MLSFLSTRQRQPEWMDDPGADPAELRRSLAFIRRVNAWLGYTRSTLGHLRRFSRRWRRDEKIRVLDLATGSADVPRAFLQWVDKVNRRRGWKWDVSIVGIDLHAQTLADAAKQTRGERRLHLVRADALKLPFADGSFDYVITSMFLHHLADEAAKAVLAEMGRVAARGVLVADLLRHRRAYAWISLFTLLANPMVRHDARVSVAQAFTRDEILRIRDRAGLTFATYHRHFGHRFVLAGEKSDIP